MKNFIKLYLPVICILFSLFTAEPFMADEKTIDVPINKNFDGCTFTVEVETAGEYEISLYAPNGEKFYFEELATSDTTYVCTVTNVKIGNWKVVVDNNASYDVGKVSVSVSKAKTEDNELDDSIHIGKEIVGLNMYLKNNTFVATWTDNSFKNVSFTITDLDTSNVISNEKCSTKSYEKELPKDVTNISVEVTSSKENGIEGTSNTYIINGMTSFEGSVTYPTVTYTNKDELYVDVIIQKEYAFYVEVNGREVVRKPTCPAGTYEVEIPLIDDGENTIQFFVVDETGNMISTDYTVFRDDVAPTLTLSQEYDGLVTKDSAITIEGVASDFDEFTINGEVIITEKNGAFSYDTNLIEGDNKITLLLKDKAGNETFYNITITVPSSKKEFPAGILLVIAALIIYFTFFKKKKTTSKTPKTALNDVFNGEDDKNTENASEMSNLDELEPSEDIFMERELLKSNEKENPLTKSRRFIENLSIIKHVVYVVALVLFFTFVLKPGHVSSGSMEPTIMTSDIVIINKLSYLAKTPQINDVISFNHDGETYCKRIIGVAGDEIFFADGYLYRNGERVEEKFLDEDIETNCTKSFVVPEGFVFVLGDNRENSYDSRFWDNPYVRVTDIQGKLLFTIPMNSK